MTLKARKQKALQALREARELSGRIRTGFEGLTEEQAIAKMRKVRESLWREKLAAHSGH